MSSGSAPQLVNGENQRNNLGGFEFASRKEDESGAAARRAASVLDVISSSPLTSIISVTTVATTTTTTITSTTAITPTTIDENGGGSGGGGGSGSAGGVSKYTSDNDTAKDGGSDDDNDYNGPTTVGDQTVVGSAAGGVFGVEFDDDAALLDIGRAVNLGESNETFGTRTENSTECSESCSTDRIERRARTGVDDGSGGGGCGGGGGGGRRSAPVIASYDDDNMVAAMNEHLSSSGTASGTTSNTGNSSGNPGNNCARNNEFQGVEEDGKPAAGILSFPCDFDHMYASMTDGGAPAATAATSALGVSPLRGNEPRQNDLTEVKHLKELLLLHLDLIQQQSEQIVTKDKLLAALRQENETLKLRLERMDRRVNLQKLRSESSENSIISEHIGTCSPTNVNSSSAPSTSELHRNIQCESGSSQYNESFKIRLNTSGGITTVKQEPNDNQGKHDVKLESGSDSRGEWEEKKKRRSDPTPLSGGSKRKRGVSCSSAVSNDISSTIQEKVLTHESGRKADRKSKLLTKRECFLTTEEHYYTAAGDPTYALNLKETNPVESGTALEVPNWRVKIYTSCYTMEGTENLDDEIFNKRHLKLENDERRRKRWDVQRIREQRHIEKLKQRQERQNHQATCYNTNHTGPCPSTVEEENVTSLWPDIEQIQSLQVDPQLPVTAFGAPIPSFTPSEFSLPWSNTSRSTSRRPKRSTGRRKSTRR